MAREEPSSARAREGDPVPLPLHQGSRASLGLATPSHLQGVSSPPLWRERALHWELRHPYPPPGIARVSGVVGRERERGREFSLLGIEREEERWSGSDARAR